MECVSFCLNIGPLIWVCGSASQMVQVSACVWSHSGGAGSMGGLWVRRPLGEPSLAGLISVSHLFQVALEELWVSPISFSKRRKEREKSPLLWNYKYLKRSNVVLIVLLHLTMGVEGSHGVGGGFLKYVSNYNREFYRKWFRLCCVPLLSWTG